jgi:hypothetical protein
MIWFNAAWLALGFACWWWIRRRASTTDSRTTQRRVTILTGIIFAVFTASVLISWHAYFALFIFLPAIALIMFINLRTSFVCDYCGKFSQAQSWSSQTHYCPHCGSKLK